MIPWWVLVLAVAGAIGVGFAVSYALAWLVFRSQKIELMRAINEVGEDDRGLSDPYGQS